MRKGSKLVLLLSGITAMVFSGTVSATYAWFELLSNNTISISGQAGSEDATVEVGVVSKVPLKDCEKFGLTLAEYLSNDEEFVYISNIALTGDAVKYILKENGYASEGIYPVTPYSYTEGDEFVLYSGPTFGAGSKKTVARPSLYSHLDLLFRAKEGGELISNSKVYLERFELGRGDFDSVRVHFQSESRNFVFNPSSKEDGMTDVGGRLDTDGDGYFDYIHKPYGSYEVYYGDYNGELIYGEPYAEDIRVTKPREQNMNAFEAPNQKKGVYPVIVDPEYVGKSEYLGTNSVLKSGTNLTKDKVLCVSDEHGIARLGMDIYMEGWDRSNVNTILGSTFGASIAFMME